MINGYSNVNLKMPTFPEQTYHCRNCKKSVLSQGVPIDWYIVRKSQGQNSSLRTVAILCSFSCLLQDTAYEASCRMDKQQGY